MYCVSIIRVFMYEGKSRFSSLTPFIVTFLWGSAQRRNGKHSLIVLLRRPRHGRFCLAVTSWRDPIPRPKSNPWVLTNQHSQTQNKIRYSNWVVKGKTQRILISVMNSDTCHFIRFLMNQIKYYNTRRLDLEAMNEACNCLLNYADFTSFSKVNTETKTKQWQTPNTSFLFLYMYNMWLSSSIHIQVRPLRKEKFNGRIHGLLPYVILPGYVCCYWMMLPVCSKSSSSKTQHADWTHFHIELLFLCHCVLLCMCTDYPKILLPLHSKSRKT